MSGDQSVFTFELNEALYFERGQEVAEIRGISLDPEITIQAFNDYISIRGVIELQGDYEKVLTVEEEQVEEDPITEFTNLEAKRYVENVSEIDGTVVQFSHKFPVEISVPTYRISNLDDVTVSVDSFDYELPEQNHLTLYSTIAIHGIDQEAELPRVEEETAIEEEPELEIEEKESEDQESEEPSETSLEREEESFEFEITQKQEESTQTEDLLTLSETPTLSEPEETEVEEKQQKEEGRWSFKTQTQSFSDFFAPKEDVIEEADDDDDLYDNNDDNDEFDNEDNDDYDYDDDNNRTEIVYENTTDDGDEDISYLSDVFRNSDEEEYTKMRLCIVQKDDTIETISERFKVSPLQLIKQNQLEEDFDVSEGQLLYIPANKSTSNKE
ncbi:stage VI sporulation protein D [Oceanobacillus halophilus]|uniref:Stage VI sporulation protein D n=1 Tax=Oceanobacillus halophilus TaxID=930130 RepID=A0A495AD75_9BACI|nr:stage VI sporulation protein D [Oceanobacillus halophilus]RKQ37921.1 stage VI sporulation protein D [Oceanobacillus halophilus]